jgi:hypothetical protein
MRITNIVSGTAVAILICIIAYQYTHPRETIVERERFHGVPVPVEVERIKTIRVPVKEVEVVDKAEALELAKLPKNTLTESQEVMAVGRVAPNEGDTTVAVVINTATGRADIVARQEDRKFFGIPKRKFELEIGAGYGTEGMVFDGAFRWKMLRTGPITWITSLDATIYENNRADAAVMIKASYAF